MALKIGETFILQPDEWEYELANDGSKYTADNALDLLGPPEQIFGRMVGCCGRVIKVTVVVHNDDVMFFQVEGRATSTDATAKKARLKAYADGAVGAVKVSSSQGDAR